MTMKYALKKALGMVVAVLMMAVVGVLASPAAEAHSGKFEHADPFLGTTCPAGYSPTGGATATTIGCTPDGYSPIGTDAALCAEAPFGYIHSSGWCTYDIARPCGTAPTFTFAIGDGYCLRLALVLNEYVTGSGFQRSLQPICIEDPLVQEFATTQSVGETFNNGERFDYLIVTGGSCTFNCIDGWDVNCDGRIGDFCRVDYDRRSATGAGMCLAEIAATAETAMPGVN